DAVAVLGRAHFDLLQRRAGWSALFDFDEHVGVVPRLHLNRSVKRRRRHRRRAAHRESLFLMDDLSLGVDGHGAPCGEQSWDQRRAAEGGWLHAWDLREKVLRGSTGFYGVLLGSTGFCSTRFYWVLFGSTRFPPMNVCVTRKS